MNPPAGPRVGPRDRLLDAADVLFRRSGVRSVGIEALIAEADVAKATFYRHFNSKEDLVVAWLRSPRARWLDRIRTAAAASAPGPAGEIVAFVETVAQWSADSAFSGCSYLRTATELRPVPPRVHAVVQSYLDEVEAYLERLASAAGLRQPLLQAERLRILVFGMLSLALVVPNPRSIAAAAGHAARFIVEDASQDVVRRG